MPQGLLRLGRRQIGFYGLWCPPERYSYDRGDFTWRQHQDGTWALHVEGRRAAVLHVVRDETYPQMWRVRDHDGRLSDMVNLSRAKDAAGIIALGILNRRREMALPGAEPSVTAEFGAQTDPALVQVPDAPEIVPEPAA